MVEIFIGDLADPAKCAELMEHVRNRFGKLDVLVNNAGMTMWSQFKDTTDPSTFKKIIDVNLLSAMYCTHYALNDLVASRGRLAFVTSVAGLVGMPAHSVYGASKRGMRGFLQALRIELGPAKVSVTEIAPDFVRTKIHQRGLRGDGQLMNKSLHQSEGISADECASMIYHGVWKRKRQVVTSIRGRLAMMLRDIAPEIVDYLVNKSVQRHSMANRAT